MSAERFTLDTNVLVYSVDAKAGRLQPLALEIVRRAATADCVICLQAISEMYAVSTRKRIISPREACEQAEDIMALFRTASASENAIRRALSAATNGRTSYWDALLLATAADAVCSAVLTEDLGEGDPIFGVRIVRPFGPNGITPEAEALLGPA